MKRMAPISPMMNAAGSAREGNSGVGIAGGTTSILSRATPQFVIPVDVSTNLSSVGEPLGSGRSADLVTHSIFDVDQVPDLTNVNGEPVI